MRVYAEPDTEESELGFRLFCVRKWVEIWGGDNNFVTIPHKTGIMSGKKAHKPGKEERGLKAWKVLWVFFVAQKWLEKGIKVLEKRK